MPRQKVKKKKIVKQRLGKANSLPGKLWSDWLHFVSNKLGPSFFLMLYLTQALCLRITQVLQLTANDFDWKAKQVWIEEFKRHEAFHKPLLSSVAKQLNKYRKKPIKSKSGKTFKWPKKGHLFPSKRSDNKLPHMAKDSVCHAIKKISNEFSEKNLPKGSRQAIRSHSGRRRCISQMANNNVPDLVGMSFSGIKSERVYKGYVDTCHEKLRAKLRRFDSTTQFGKMPSKPSRRKS